MRHQLPMSGKIATDEHLTTTLCYEEDILYDEYRSITKKRKICVTRFLIWSILKSKFKYTYNEIGYIYGKDHTTIMHGVKYVQKNRNLLKRKQEFIENNLN